jgi:ribosome-associated heat shock protein Hsp15
METVRVDRWLWSVRLFKTRSLATEACRAGHVAVNGGITKASTPVRVGDTVTVRTGGTDKVVEVARVIATRVGAAVASECLVDRSPAPAPREPSGLVRDRSAGRPTKRDRRMIDRLRRR